MFNYHPSPLGLNARTNLYFLQTSDMGKTWTTVENKPVSLLLDTVQNPALVRDFRKEGLLVYLKNVDFDAAGHPVILFLTSKSSNRGRRRTAPMAHRAVDRQAWEYRPFTTSDHNYDYGFLSIEPDGTWRIIGATRARSGALYDRRRYRSLDQ